MTGRAEGSAVSNKNRRSYGATKCDGKKDVDKSQAEDEAGGSCELECSGVLSSPVAAVWGELGEGGKEVRAFYRSGIPPPIHCTTYVPRLFPPGLVSGNSRLTLPDSISLASH